MAVFICTSCRQSWKAKPGDTRAYRECPFCKGTLVSGDSPLAEPKVEPETARGWPPLWTAGLIALAFLIIGGMFIAAIVTSSKHPPSAAITAEPVPATTKPAPLATTPPDTVPPHTGPSKPAAMRTPAELFATASPAVVRVVVRDKDFKMVALGSGFFVSADGLLVTNFHVIKGAQFATVLLSDESTLFVDGIAATDEANDLALLKVNATKLPFLTPADAPPPPAGTKVYAIGNPEGLTNTFSEGMVSALREKHGKPFAIQTTAPISPGSSGGPLLTADGQVVGVTRSTLAEGQNLNFAVPAAQVIQLVKNRGKLTALASAGGKSLDKDASAELDKVWDAINKKDWRLALSILAKLRPESGDSSYYWFTTGYVQSELGNYDLAVDANRECLKLHPDDAAAYFNMGNAYSDQGRYAEAVAAFQSAIAIDPNDADAYRNMGAAYDHQKKYADAVTAYKSAIAIHPNYADAYTNMGVAYKHQERYAEAIAAYKSAIAINPNDAHPHFNMGIAYADQKKYAESVAAYRSAIAIDPDYAGAYFNLGIVYDIEGKHAEAAAAYRKAVELDPNGEAGRRAKEQLHARIEAVGEKLVADKSLSSDIGARLRVAANEMADIEARKAPLQQEYDYNVRVINSNFDVIVAGINPKRCTDSEAKLYASAQATRDTQLKNLAVDYKSVANGMMERLKTWTNLKASLERDRDTVAKEMVDLQLELRNLRQQD